MRRLLVGVTGSRGFALLPEMFYGWAIVVVVVSIALYMVFGRADSSIMETAESYLCALATGDIAAAREVSTGRAGDAASRLEGKDLAAQVVDMKVQVEAYSDRWARAVATVELALKDGSPDVGWYELELVKEGRAWKVYGFREVPPVVKGNVSGLPKWLRLFAGDSVGEKQLREADAVFRGYLEDLAAGRYKEAARWLAGPALREHLAAGDVLGRGKVLDAVSDLSLTPLVENGKLLVARLDYRVEEKKFRVVVFFYRIAQDWKIVEVNSL